jgi:prophage regulatory protein
MASMRHQTTAPTALSSGVRELPRLVRLQDVCRTTGLCRSMIYKMEAENRFPQRVRIGHRAVGWVESEVAQWVAERITASRAAAAVTRVNPHS